MEKYKNRQKTLDSKAENKGFLPILPQSYGTFLDNLSPSARGVQFLKTVTW